MKEHVADFFDHVVKKDDDSSWEAFTMYFEQKAKEIFKEMNEADKPVRLKGNDVLVNGKKVGTIHHDTEDDSGIEYTSEEGKKSKHESLPKLFAHLTKEHKLDEAKGDMYVLQTKKKGTDKWGTQFSGTKQECTDEWRDTKHDWAGYDHRVVPHVDESLAETGNKELANKSEKEFKSFKNDDELKLTKQAAHKDNADHSDAEKEHAAANKKKAASRAKVDAAAKTYRKVDWKL